MSVRRKSNRGPNKDEMRVVNQEDLEYQVSNQLWLALCSLFLFAEPLWTFDMESFTIPEWPV